MYGYKNQVLHWHSSSILRAGCDPLLYGDENQVLYKTDLLHALLRENSLLYADQILLSKRQILRVVRHQKRTSLLQSTGVERGAKLRQLPLHHRYARLLTLSGDVVPDGGRASLA